MADNVTLPGAGIPVASEELNGVQHQLVKLEFGEAGTVTKVSESSPLPVAVAFPGVQPVSGTVTVANQISPLTDEQLRASPLPVDVEDMTNEIVAALTKLTRMVMYPPYVDRSANQIRAQVSGSLSTVSTVSTVSAVSSVSAVDGYQGRQLMLGMNINAWANTVRRSIS